MTMTTINRAANDVQLQARVLAAAHKAMAADEDLVDTNYGRQLQQGVSNVMPLMWKVAVDRESEYAGAVTAGKGSPGHDPDIITDAMITTAVIAGWPPDVPGPGA